MATFSSSSFICKNFIKQKKGNYRILSQGYFFPQIAQISSDYFTTQNENSGNPII
jgi:hypothetical protein